MTFLVIRAMFSGMWQRLVSKPFELLGLFMVCIAYRYRDTPLGQQPWWLTPWVNPEDWTGGWRGFLPGDNCVPPDLRERYSGFWGFWRYHALRNRANGLRNYHWYNMRLFEGAITYLTPKYYKWYQNWYFSANGFAYDGASYWFIAWQGKAYSFKYIKYFRFLGKIRYYECRFGWRINPADARLGYRENSFRWKYGTTATFQPIHIGTAHD